MGKIDYSKVSDEKIFESGLLSDSSYELRKIIIFREIQDVKSFLEYFDNVSLETFPNLETYVEARGLADLLKYMYFDTPLVMDVYFDQPIKYFSFTILGSSVWMYGIKNNKLISMNLHTLLKRLGFNDDERNIILNVSEDYLNAVKLIDLLNNAYDRIKSMSDKYNGLYNKLLLIRGYYLRKNDKSIESNFTSDVLDKLDELGDLLARKNALEKLNNSIKYNKGGKK